MSESAAEALKRIRAAEEQFTLVYQIPCSNGAVLTVRQTREQAKATYRALGFELAQYELENGD
jgi:ribosomal protein S18 acetylase RimI-like enzyme